MKRYDLKLVGTLFGDEVDMVESPNGDYVEFEDAMAEIEELRSRLGPRKVLSPDKITQEGYYWHRFGRWVDNTGHVRHDEWEVVEVSKECGGGFGMRLFNGVEFDLEGEFIGPLVMPEMTHD